MSKRKGKVGRPRKFKNGAVAKWAITGQLYHVVDHRLRGTKAEYRCVPVNARNERFGRARWISSSELIAGDGNAKRSSGSIKTYRANQKLDEQLGGRGCDCQCCVHTAIPLDMFSTNTGEFKDD